MRIRNIFCLLGHGVFAKINFEKGDFLLEYKGKSEIVYVLLYLQFQIFHVYFNTLNYFLKDSSGVPKKNFNV